MKKIILIAAMAVMSIAASAQDLKLAYVDFNEIIMLMPEMDQARATLEENQKTNEEILMAMYEEYQAKAQQFQSRLEQTQQSLQQEMQQLQNSLQAPIYEKAQNTVNEIAKSKGIAAVFEMGSLLYVDPAQLINLTAEARVALNIPEDRTLESLQAELQAKAQAAQAAQMQ